MKREWEKPKLIVLVRGKTEENVLFSCKTSSPGNAGPGISRPVCAVVGAPCFALNAS